MKKLFIFLILGILLVGGIFLFVNRDKSTIETEELITYPQIYVVEGVKILKDYNINEKEITLKDETNNLILTSQLNTPQNYKVGAGYGKVAQFTINPGQDGSDVLGAFELYDKTNNNTLIERQIDIKYLTTQQVEENIYGEDNCFLEINGTETCEWVIVGTQFVEEEIWLPFDNSIKNNEEIIIGLFTDVQIKDKVEWVTTIAGVKINEWAVWTADLNVDLLYYYAFEEGAGNFIDQVSGNNLVENGAVGRVPGKIGQGVEFDDNDANYLESIANVGIAGVNPRTLCFWAEQDTLDRMVYLGWGVGGTGAMYEVEWLDNAGYKLSVRCIGTDFKTLIPATTNMDFHCIVLDGTNMNWYRNAVSIWNGTADPTSPINTVDDTLIVGISQGYDRAFDGVIDELSIHNRTLTGTEVVYMYNEDAGMTYTDVFTLAPIISLNSPIDTYNSTSQTIVFNGTVYDDINLINVSLYLDGVLNETNSSGINNTDYIFTKTLSEGSHNWTYEAWDNESGVTTATTRHLTIDTAPIINIISPLNQTYTTSLIKFNATSSLVVDTWIINYNGTNITIFNSTLNHSLGVEEGLHHLLLYANNSVSGILGLNDTIYFAVELTEPVVALISPEDNLGTENTTFLFEANTTAGNYTLTNATIYVWHSNETLMQSETNTSIAGTSDANVSFNLSGFSLGGYKWNVQVNYENIVLGIHNSVFATNNRTLNIKAILSSIIYNNNTYETKRETFAAEFDIVADSEISLAQLVYNGTNYTITNLTTTSTTLTLQKAIDIPLNLNTLANETKSFFFRFTYGGGFIQEADAFEQNISFINFQQCNTTYPTQSLNFTFFNEINQTNINAGTNPTTFESNWKYWIGSGDIYKTYSFQNLSSSLNNYQFCMYPYSPNNYTFRINGDIEFSATAFRENEHHLRNATMTNVSNDVLLYLLHTNYATKFFLTFKQGTTLIEGATITIQKYFTGLGEFNTVGIQFSDDNGEATMWGEVDKIYKFFIVKDGELLGTVERNAICAVAPCTLSIIIEELPADLFESYYEIFGQNIVSTLGFNKTSKIITYAFVDTTGLANYFRLKVQRVMLNETKDIICNSQSFSTAGTLTCNLTGKIGEFKATTYVSRSPELIDKVLSVITDEDILEGLGLIGVFLVMALIITIVFAAAIIGRGSPSVVLWALAASIVLLKLAHLFPFTWAVVITLEVIIFFLISQVKT